MTGPKKPAPRPWEPLFLDTLADTGSVWHAAAQAGVSREAVYKARAKDPDFAARWSDAIAKAKGALEEAAIRRAREGTKSLVVQGGEIVKDETGQPIHEVKLETSLTIFMLKRHCPQKYDDDWDQSPPVDLGDTSTIDGIAAARSRVVDAHNAGRISGARFDRLLRGLDALRDDLTARDFGARLAAVESALAAGSAEPA